MNCKICGSQSRWYTKKMVLGRLNADYFLCPACGFIQTEEPYWLDAAYSDAINKSDTGLVRRNSEFSMITQSVICNLFDQKSRFIDYGGGHGLFVRMMRDLGFDFYWSDKYCSNIFAKEFAADIKGTHQYELLTAFEVFEHLVDPRAEISKMLEFSEGILFSTNLIPEDRATSEDWWYYGPEHGQHVSFFSLETLKFIAAEFKLNLYTNGSSIHLLSPKKMSPLFFKVLASYKISKIYGLIFKKASLIQSDYQKISSKSQPGR